eukprot:Hpha_TRINITY_DN16216_c1_g1::TRINITY_DN16216_c1_g1_i35::g.12775::m.12775
MPKSINDQLVQAAQWGNTATVRRLVESGASLEAKGGWGYTALMKAAMYGHTATVQLLLDKGARVEAKDNDGGTPLDYARMNSRHEVATILRDYPEAARRKKAAEEAEAAR